MDRADSGKRLPKRLVQFLLPAPLRHFVTPLPKAAGIRNPILTDPRVNPSTGLLAALIAAALMTAGCGGTAKHAALVSPTKDFTRCLSAYPLDWSGGDAKDADYIAQGAPNYIEMRTRDGNFVNVSIWRSVGDAQDAEDAYRAVQGHGGLLTRQVNVVFAWDKTPTGPQRTDLEFCVLRAKSA